MALERFDAFDAGKFWHVQGARAHADELRGEVIATVGADAPARFCRVPIEACGLGVKQRVVVQTILLADTLAVREDFRRMRVLLRRHVPGFLEQGHVDHRGGIALRARITVPVPGAAEVATLLDDPDVLHAGFRHPRRSGEPGKAAADEGEGDGIGLRLARRDRRYDELTRAARHAMRRLSQLIERSHDQVRERPVGERDQTERDQKRVQPEHADQRRAARAGGARAVEQLDRAAAICERERQHALLTAAQPHRLVGFAAAPCERRERLRCSEAHAGVALDRRGQHTERRALTLEPRAELLG